MCQGKKCSFSSSRTAMTLLVIVILTLGVVVDSKSVRKDIDRIVHSADPDEALNNILKYLYPTPAHAYKLPSIHHRPKRSPYPPGFIMWNVPSAGSQSLPCICTPGDIKCRCLKQLELNQKGGKVRVIRSKSKAAKA